VENEAAISTSPSVSFDTTTPSQQKTPVEPPPAPPAKPAAN
jgi:hypothetical protein